MFDIPCVILAGGKSSRMGENKVFLPFKHTILIDYQYNKLSKIFHKVYISSKTNKFEKDYNLILDEGEVYSPLLALKSIFTTIKNDSVFIISVDTPFVSARTMEKLIKKNKNYDITIARDKNNSHNLLGVFKKTLLKNIEENLSKDIYKINFLIKQSKSNIVEFENEDEFLNINFKEDYDKALKQTS